MSKTRMNISVDYDVWLYWKGKNTNVSEMINNFLKGTMLVDQEHYEKAEVELEIEDIKNEAKEIQNKLVQAQLKLVRIAQEEEEKTQQDLQRDEYNLQKAKSMKALNPMRFI